MDCDENFVGWLGAKNNYMDIFVWIISAYGFLRVIEGVFKENHSKKKKKKKVLGVCVLKLQSLYLKLLKAYSTIHFVSVTSVRLDVGLSEKEKLKRGKVKCIECVICNCPVGMLRIK